MVTKHHNDLVHRPSTQTGLTGPLLHLVSWTRQRLTTTAPHDGTPRRPHFYRDGPTLQTTTVSYVYPYGPMFTMTTPHKILARQALKEGKRDTTNFGNR
ncbi:hypothetical protein E2C01_000560 [Portunus trituberculatus]|uniref:Uncharacterized protein n=1 Tax=Portunus trituberculatus TaxID=210409 RepID=A0A5B7CGW4_PORTR|nr:hypothetical protein [Portunus trituberculatus]